MHPDDKGLTARVVPRLVDEIVDENPRVRLAAVRALADLKPGPQLVLPEIERVLKDADPEVVNRALDAIASLGPKAVPALIDALEHDDARPKAAAILARIGPEAGDAVPALVEAVEEGDDDGRREALFALAAIGPAASKAVPAMVAALDDPNMNVRYSAAYALGRMGPVAKQAKTALHEKLDGADRFLATVAAWALAQIDPACPATSPKSVPVLIHALESPQPAVRFRAIEALQCLGPKASDAVEALEALRDDADPTVRQAAAEALAAIRSEDDSG
jgi:HEAT repeat protein